MKIRVHQFEEELGLVLPDELIASLGWESGDVLDVQIDNDGLRIVRVETAFENAMRIAERAMDDYRETLQTLAKS
jgi:antitoxin component of MazEF toxin-antitoxin module